MKKILSIKYLTLYVIVLAVLSTNVVLLIQPKVAMAIPVEITGSVPIPIATILTSVPESVSLSKTVAQWIKDDLMKGLRDVVAKQILDYVVNQTVRWVQGGGKPSFVSNWNTFVRDAGNIAFNGVIQQVGLAQLCSPFAYQVRVSLLPVQTFTNQLQCTLDQFTSNIQNFYTNFSNGGWLAYNSMWEPQNNYYGQMIMINDQIQTQTSKQVTAATNEAISGSGFLSQKKCVQRNEEGYQMCLQSGLSASECEQASCLKQEIVTPGSTIGATVASAITTDSQWAANIQSWTSALVNAAINRLVSTGLSVMQGSSGGGITYQPPAGQNNQFVYQQSQDMINTLQPFLNEQRYILNAKNRSLSFAQRILSDFNRMATTSGCSISETEIAGAQSEVDRLNNETAAYQNSVNELNNEITQLQNTTDPAAFNNLYANYISLLSKYNTASFQTQIVDGSGRKAVDNEAQAKQQALSDADNRLAACQSPQTNQGNNQNGDTGR